MKQIQIRNVLNFVGTKMYTVADQIRVLEKLVSQLA